MSAPRQEPSHGQRTEIAIAVVERDGSFLIGLRPAGQALAGYWEFPGGKLAPGETAEQAAMRECREETGLLVRVKGHYPSANYDYEHGTLRLHFLACASDDDALPPARFRWVSRADLSQYRFPPANAPLLARLARE